MERYIAGISLSTNVTLGNCIPIVSYVVNCFWDGMSILSNLETLKILSVEDRLF